MRPSILLKKRTPAEALEELLNAFGERSLAGMCRVGGQYEAGAVYPRPWHSARQEAAREALSFLPKGLLLSWLSVWAEMLLDGEHTFTVVQGL